MRYRVASHVQTQKEATVSEYLRRIELALTAEKEANQTLLDERDRLREALEQVVYHLAQPGDDEALVNQYVPTAAETLLCQHIIEVALKLAGRGQDENATA